jgi:hypothetical protein
MFSLQILTFGGNSLVNVATFSFLINELSFEVVSCVGVEDWSAFVLFRVDSLLDDDEDCSPECAKMLIHKLPYFNNLLGSGKPSFCPIFNEMTYGELAGSSELARGFGVGFFFSNFGESATISFSLTARGFGRGKLGGCLKAPITGGRALLVDCSSNP